MSAYDQATDSAPSYGTQANFAANYQLSSTMLNTYKAPFQWLNRIWLGGYSLYKTDVADYDSRLQALGIAHTRPSFTSAAHRWDSGWMPTALLSLEVDSLVYGIFGGARH